MSLGSHWVFALLSCQVTLCSNTVRQYELALVVDVDGVGKEVLALLLTARYRAFLPAFPLSWGFHHLCAALPTACSLWPCSRSTV